MGTWGVGLYSGDFAMDLRGTVGAVSRLPYDADRIAGIVAGVEPGAAGNPSDPDHTTFWLVLADQFAKRGLDSARVREAALEIIDSGRDLERLAELGLTPGGLAERRRRLEELREQLSAPAAPARPRRVLKKPQPLLFETGDVVLYPTDRGKGVNPYFRSKEQDRQWDAGVSRPWTRDGWAAFVVIDCGRAFDFLAWYRPLTLLHAMLDPPDLDALRSAGPWELRHPGTCSAPHFRRMELRVLGRLSLRPDAVARAFPGLRPGTSAAVNDVSIANSLRVAAAGETRRALGQRAVAIDALDRLLRSVARAGWR